MTIVWVTLGILFNVLTCMLAYYCGWFRGFDDREDIYGQD